MYTHIHGNIQISGLRGGRRLFRAMLNALCRAPMRFFDTTPTGRILNRCLCVCVCVCECTRACWLIDLFWIFWICMCVLYALWAYVRICVHACIFEQGHVHLCVLCVYARRCTNRRGDDQMAKTKLTLQYAYWYIHTYIRTYRMTEDQNQVDASICFAFGSVLAQTFSVCV